MPDDNSRRLPDASRRTADDRTADDRTADDRAADDRPEGETTRAAGLPSGEVRIGAPEAAVAAGLLGLGGPVADADAGASASPNPTEVFELPDWSDPPTGQVPRVFLEDPDGENDPGSPALRGPTWRQSGDDWNEDADMLFLMEPDEDDRTQVAGRVDPMSAPFEFSFEELGGPGPGPGPGPEAGVVASDTPDEEAAWDQLFEVPEELAFRRNARARRRHVRNSVRAPSGRPRAPADAPSREVRPQETGRGEVTKPERAKRNLTTSILTGVVLAGVAVGCFYLGAVSSLVLVVVFVLLAAGETFASLRRAGHRPATLPGLAGVLGLIVGAYLFGFAAFPFVLALAMVLTGLWYLAERSHSGVVVGYALTMFVLCWIGVLGAFAGLLLAPSVHPDRHGVALLIGVVAVTVANDIGAYAIGSRLGGRRLAPRVSPNKTVGGLIGGTVVALLVGGLALSRLHPFTTTTGLVLAVVACVLAPLGDLVESLVKRDLGLKDMGRMLPGHGGLLDRADAMLFVLPGAFYLARLFHIA